MEGSYLQKYNHLNICISYFQSNHKSEEPDMYIYFYILCYLLKLLSLTQKILILHKQFDETATKRMTL